MKGKDKKGQSALLQLSVWGIVGLITIVIILLFSTIYTVGAGERAILLTWGSPDSTPQMSGLHFKIPIAQSVVIMEVRTLKYDAKATAASQDLQTVNTDVAVNYHINPDSVVTIYKTIGTDYETKIIMPAVQEVVKSVTAKFTAEQLITQRSVVKDQIDIALADRLLKSNIVMETTSITNFDFSQTFNVAIENKVTAEQNALAAKNVLEQKKYEAQQLVITAQGQADASKLQIATINQNGGMQYLQWIAIQKWDGKMPLVVGSGSMPFIGNVVQSQSIVGNYTNSTG
jgi:prohibitin 2